MTDLELYWPYILTGLIGLIAGWLASFILGGGGLLRNLIVGVIGAFVGSFLVKAGLLPLSDSIKATVNVVPYGEQILVSTIGALIIIALARIIAR
jgi:uncharacterized membrane protein YeaQ/YmgE (transglycosylase-associated protein family)